MKISFAEPDLPRSGAVVVGVWEGKALTPAASRIDEAAGGAIARALSAPSRFTGKKDELLPIVAPPNISASRIVVAGLGKPESADSGSLQQLGGTLFAHLNAAGEEEATVMIDIADTASVGPAEAAAEIAFGAQLRSYRFDKYKTKQKPEQKPSLTHLTVATSSANAAKRAYRPLEKTAAAVFLTRDLVSEPANVIYPETLATAAEGLTGLGIEVETLDETKMRELGMNALLAVGQGSARPSRLVVMQWHGVESSDGARGRPLAFVGKGVTFDTGGISIKPAAGMGDMKHDMSGAGNMVGLMVGVAALSPNVEVHAILACAASRAWTTGSRSASGMRIPGPSVCPSG